MGKGRFEELENMQNLYNSVYEEHRHINVVKAALRSCPEFVIFRESDKKQTLEEYLSIYNNMQMNIISR
jgi:hypothetical protein